MLLLAKTPAIPAVLISVGLLELVCSSSMPASLGFGPPQKMALVLGFLITLIIWLILSGRGERSENDQEQEERLGQ